MEHIRPDPESPRFWLYDGTPTLLLGGSWQDNLFNHPSNLEAHLDLLESVGGNYVRNVMSHRNEGNVYPYVKEDDLFSLDEFNPEYWNRFERFLQLTSDRDIVIQIEIWATWDLYIDHQSKGGWSYQPYNPANNRTYTAAESGLPESIEYAPAEEPTEHPFFRTVPALEDNTLVRSYQEAFVDALLDRSLEFPNVLYCMNNETGEPNEWGDYWLQYVRDSAANRGVEIQTTDMRRNEDVRGQDHQYIFDRPDRYTFVDISQNNAWAGKGQGHYDNIRYVHEQTSNAPRPINNVKNYGASRHGEEESIARFCRIVFAGCASARFHRPHPIEDPTQHQAASETGLGLSERAQRVIESMRALDEKIDIPGASPSNDLLEDREPNEAYAISTLAPAYAVYFPDEGSVSLHLRQGEETFALEWLDVDECEWHTAERVRGPTLELSTPRPGHSVALLTT